MVYTSALAISWSKGSRKYFNIPHDGTLCAEGEWRNLCNRTPGHMATVLRNPVNDFDSIPFD